MPFSDRKGFIGNLVNFILTLHSHVILIEDELVLVFRSREEQLVVEDELVLVFRSREEQLVVEDELVLFLGFERSSL